MIIKLTETESCRDFISLINADHDYSEPFRCTDEKVELSLKKALSSPDQVPLGVYDGERMTGIFVFLVVEEEKYIEMLLGLSREIEAYEEIADWLLANYPGFQVDFVFNPKNPVIRIMLEKRGAEFYTEQKKMVLKSDPPPVDTAGIEPLSDRYEAQYVAIHSLGGYWTGERILCALDTFSVFLALDGERAVGYIDVTRNNDENEPFDLFVLEDSRRRGWGRKLLAKAIEASKPKGMMLTVDVDNFPAIALYRSMGFEDDPEPLNQVATWHIDE